MKKMNHGVFAAALMAVVVAGCTGRSRTVATVGDIEISADEFAKRYKQFLTRAPQRDNILLRQRILNNIINEQLILEDVHRQGFDTDADFEKRLGEIRIQALLDRYSKRISTDTVSVSDQELWKEFRSFKSRVSARYLYAGTEAGALRLKERLEQGEKFESLSKEVFEDPGLAQNGGYLGYFGWGEMEPALEEAAFSLPVGTVSDPIRLQVGFAIVKVENRVENPLASEYDFARNKEKLSHAIVEKKVVRLIKDEVDHISSDLAPSFDEETLARVFDRWNLLLDDRGWTEGGSPFGDVSTRPLVTFRDVSWSVQDLLVRMAMTTRKQRERVQSVGDLKDMCIGLAAREVLLERAQDAGLENDPQVLAQIQETSNEYVLKRWRSGVQDTVGQHGWDETPLRAHYRKNSREYVYPPEVNVAEILVRTEAEAWAMAARLDRGESFSGLARRNSVRPWARKRGGELGFGPESKFGILGKKFFAAQPGQIIGPEFVDPYHGVFKILARRAGRMKTFEEARRQIIEELSFTAREKAFAAAVGSLRNRSVIMVDQEILANIVIE